MALIRWNPWSIDRFFDDDWDVPTIPGISKLMGQGLNLYETEKEIVAEAALPGISEENIDLTVEEGVVRIIATKEEKRDDGRRNFMSTLSSSYNYAFRLPQAVVKDKDPEAELSDGLLTLRFSKVQKTTPKKLKIARKNKETAEIKTSKKS